MDSPAPACPPPPHEQSAGAGSKEGEPYAPCRVFGVEARRVTQMACGQLATFMLVDAVGVNMLTRAAHRATRVYCLRTADEGTEGIESTATWAHRRYRSARPTLQRSFPHHVVQIACGARHTVLRTADDEVWCLGEHTDGQLGLPGATSFPRDSLDTPLRLDTMSGRGMLDVSCGARHTLFLCERAHGADDPLALVPAPATQVWGCGDNDFGQLGQDPASAGRRLHEPTAIPALEGIGAARLCCGAFHSLVAMGTTLRAQTKGRGAQAARYAWAERLSSVRAFGRNDDGQLGVGLGEHTVHAPTLVRGMYGMSIRQMACGEQHSVFLATGAEGPEVLACGWNGGGQLGLGAARQAARTPQRVTALSGRGVSSVACGAQHSVFAAAGSDQVWGCGRNSHGQLGPPTRAPLLVPRRLPHLCGQLLRFPARLGEHETVASTGLLRPPTAHQRTVLAVQRLSLACLLHRRVGEFGVCGDILFSVFGRTARHYAALPLVTTALQRVREPGRTTGAGRSAPGLFFVSGLPHVMLVELREGPFRTRIATCYAPGLRAAARQRLRGLRRRARPPLATAAGAAYAARLLSQSRRGGGRGAAPRGAVRDRENAPLRFGTAGAVLQLIRAAAASLFGGAPSRLRSPLTRRGHSPRPMDSVVPRDAIPLDKRRKSARHWAAESGRGRKTDSSHANVAAVAPLIPISRPHTRGDPGKVTVWRLRPRDQRGHSRAALAGRGSKCHSKQHVLVPRNRLCNAGSGSAVCAQWRAEPILIPTACRAWCNEGRHPRSWLIQSMRVFPSPGHAPQRGAALARGGAARRRAGRHVA